ncbi:MAG: DUF3467 domain-containing protein [Bythopirellula sp.]|nr:DUF3467 domain-containing protein [Bythopirellula sp.]
MKTEKEKPSLDAADSAEAGKSSKVESPQATQVKVDDSGSLCTYANFCRVTGTPEELILDFGLNSQPFGVPTEPVEVKQRLIVNYYTAKRLLHALHLSIQRHEQAFGSLEVDVQKRVVNRPTVGG